MTVLPDLVVGVEWSDAAAWCSAHPIAGVTVRSAGQVLPEDVRPGARVVLLGAWPDDDRAVVRLLALMKGREAVLISERSLRGCTGLG